MLLLVHARVQLPKGGDTQAGNWGLIINGVVEAELDTWKRWMQAEVRRSSGLCIFSADGALMSDDLWADQGGQRRKRRLRRGKKERMGQKADVVGA